MGESKGNTATDRRNIIHDAGFVNIKTSDVWSVPAPMFGQRQDVDNRMERKGWRKGENERVGYREAS